jgi:hypothetical protein
MQTARWISVCTLTILSGRPSLTDHRRDTWRTHLTTTVRDWLETKGQHRVHLSYEELSPLISDFMTEEERLMQQILVAKIFQRLIVS